MKKETKKTEKKMNILFNTCFYDVKIILVSIYLSNHIEC